MTSQPRSWSVPATPHSAHVPRASSWRTASASASGTAWVSRSMSLHGSGWPRRDTLVAGDVVTIEPGIEGLEGIGGVRFEDLLLITEDGCETLTRYAYDL